VLNLKVIRLRVCVLWQFFCKCAKRSRKKRRKWATFWRLIFQEQLAQFTSDLVCVFSRYAGTCTAILLLFGQETTELRMCVKSYFVLRVNVVCARPDFLGRTTHYSTVGRLWARAWFPEIVFRKVCVSVCLYVCMYICLSFRTHVSKSFTWSLKAACIQSLKG